MVKNIKEKIGKDIKTAQETRKEDENYTVAEENFITARERFEALPNCKTKFDVDDEEDNDEIYEIK